MGSRFLLGKAAVFLIETGVARREEWPRLIKLWQAAFGDGEAFIQGFFERWGSPDRLLVLREDGVVMSMLALLPMEGVTAAGERALLPYVYALATDPEQRGKGWAKKLLDYAADRAGDMGAAGICTVPAEPSLHNFFASAGYGECFAARRQTVPLTSPTAGGEVRGVGAAEYAELREELLTGVPHGAWDGELTAIQEGFSQSSGGGLYRLELEGQTGCAAVERHGALAVAKELLCPEGLFPQAAALLAGALGAEQWELRAPADVGAGELWKFGMAIWFDERLGKEFGREAYLGLAFD